MPRVRFDGGIIGSLNTPTTSVASGIWTVKDNEEYTRRGLWPLQSSPVGSLNVAVLIVAGGGGGGASWGGGGGAGSITYNSNYNLPTGINYPIIIGAGGAASSANGVKGSNGTSSSFYTLSSTGGGGGGSWDGGASYPQTTGVFIGNQGASGGGSSSKGSIGGANTLGLGYAGGAGLSDNNSYDSGGGGGGAGGIGATATGGTGAAGGTGVAYNITGTSIYYAGGGGGGSTGSGGAGGTGGGGAGGGTNSTPGTSANTGQGGGGGGGSVGAGLSGGKGGSGIVIISYPLPQYFTGGIVTNINGANVVHTFNTSSSLKALTTPIDTYQPYNTLLLHADGTNGSNNSVFLDSSANNLSITKTGTPTQGTFSPFSTTGWSNYFNTTSDYINTASNSGFGFSGAFTIELWAFFTTSASGLVTGVATAGGISLYENSSLLTANLYGTGDIFASTFNVANNLGKWLHIVVARGAGNAMNIWVNGTSCGTGTSATVFTAGAWSVTYTNGPKGYFSNLRVTNTDVYGVGNSTIIVPNSALSAVAGTLLLTCQSNQFVDNSSSPNTITVTGTPQVQPFSPFSPTAAYSNTVVGGSMYFNGTTDYIQATVSAAPGTGDFTMEGWVYLPAFNTGAPNIFSIVGSGSNAGFQVYINSSGVGIRCYSGFSYITSGFTPTVGQWYHVACVRASGTVKIYVNGISYLTQSITTNFTDTQFNAGWTPIAQYLKAYISNIRYVNGIAVYTGNFTPPTAPFTSSSSASTALLLNGTNASIIDNTQKIDLITSGSAAISSTQSKFGGTSMYFDGSTGYVRAPHNAMLDLSTGAPNFTVECWFYTANNTAQVPIVSKDGNQGTTNSSYGINLGSTATTLVYVIADGTSGSILNYYTYTGIAINTWYHVALVRNGSNMLSFLNGNLVNTQTISITTKDAGTTFNIGTNNNNGSYFNGYIDEVRISKVARYTSNFTPQTSAFLNT